MSNDDIADLVGIYPTPLRWNAETGVLWLSFFNSETGEWEVKEIELNGPESRFAMDLPTRERGYGLIRAGVYDMKLTPVGTTAPGLARRRLQTRDRGLAVEPACWRGSARN